MPVPGVGERGMPPISRTSVTRLWRTVSAWGTSAEATPRVLKSATATVNSKLETMPMAPKTTHFRAARLPSAPVRAVPVDADCRAGTAWAGAAARIARERPLCRTGAACLPPGSGWATPAGRSNGRPLRRYGE